jgi:hypothetical protein
MKNKAAFKYEDRRKFSETKILTIFDKERKGNYKETCLGKKNYRSDFKAAYKRK